MIRDSLHNPDTDVFMEYTLAGAYDSNIALLLTVGDSRESAYEQMAEVLAPAVCAARISRPIAFTTAWCTGFLAERLTPGRPRSLLFLTRRRWASSRKSGQNIDVAWQQL